MSNRCVLPALVAGLVIVALSTDGAAEGRPSRGLQAPRSDLHGDLRPGPYPAGFRVQRVAMDGGPALPTAIDLYRWYPAAADGPRMTLGDYYRVSPMDRSSDADLPSRLLDDMTSPPDVSSAALDELLEVTLWASRDAERRVERFPLVLWTYRDSVPTMQTALAEYLASHGFEVAFAWPVDRVPPFPWAADLDTTGKRAALDAQVATLGHVLDFLSADALVDAEHTAVLSWSYGGESAHALQRDRAEVRVAIGLDSNLVSGWVYRPVDEIADLGPGDTPAPHVLIRHGSPRIGSDPTATPQLLSRTGGGAWFARLLPLHHGNFNFPGGMLPGLLGLETVSGWAVGGRTAQLGYETASRLVLHFASVYLRGGANDAPAWLSDLPDGFAEIEFFPGEAGSD